MSREKHLKFGFNNAGKEIAGDLSSIVENLSSNTNGPLISSLFRRSVKEIYQFNSKDVISGSQPYVKARHIKISKKSNSKYFNKFEGISYHFLNEYEFPLDQLDVVFVRGDDIEENQSFSKMNSQSNIIFMNSPEATLMTKDKFRTMERAEDYGLKTPLSYKVESPDDLKYALSQIAAEYKVIKGRFGFGGETVWRVREPYNEEELAGYLDISPRGLLVQEYMPVVSKGDVRIVSFDGEFIGGPRLRTPKSDWRTNVGLGAATSIYEWNKGLKAEAEKSLDAFSDVRFAGMDFLVDGTFIEINAFPASLRPLNKAYGINSEDIILDTMIEDAIQ